MSASESTCSECDHAFELSEDASVVVCNAHHEYRSAAQAGCSHYAPRKFLTESSVTEVWHPESP
ncbi:hypothetical protein [Azospira restricta]|uniref:Uncharacterized protein n=1 Tax=Azospira restricta TaxID=404405 RepID=A0A974SQ76_9RHOO|nr:hypothetical protein [Azospira restricta]QRJ64493.1 hypothetical protein IWH25_03835 [Azospira restricta]